MGWMRTLFMGDIGNRLDIADTEREIRHMRRRMKNRLRYKEETDQSQNERLDHLERELDQAKVFEAALLNLLVNKGLLTESELGRLIEQVEDDVIDEIPEG